MHEYTTLRVIKKYQRKDPPWPALGSSLASFSASPARFARSLRMYRWYALLLHLPRSLMVESSTPCSAAVVAAPIRKLCPEIPALLAPASSRALLTSSTKRGLVSGLPSSNLKRGPGPSFPRHQVRHDGRHRAQLFARPSHVDVHPNPERVRFGRLDGHRDLPWLVGVVHHCLDTTPS